MVVKLQHFDERIPFFSLGNFNQAGPKKTRGKCGSVRGCKQGLWPQLHQLKRCTPRLFVTINFPVASGLIHRGFNRDSFSSHDFSVFWNLRDAKGSGRDCLGYPGENTKPPIYHYHPQKKSSKKNSGVYFVG